MKRNYFVITFIVILTFIISSCGNVSKGPLSVFEKSDKEKAEEFIKTLGKDANVLLVLPSSDSVSVYFTQKNLIKCHNVETDSTFTIPYRDDIDEDNIGDILAGKNNIMVTTLDYDEIDGVYVYDVAKGRFSKIDPCPDNMKLTDTKLSQSNQCITFTCDTIAKAPLLGLEWFFDPSLDINKEKAKTGYYQVVKSYNFDGKLIKTKRIPISNEEWSNKEKAAKEDDGGEDNSSSSNAVYLWRCDKCGEERESVDKPSMYGCEWNGHQWTRLSRVRK